MSRGWSVALWLALCIGALMPAQAAGPLPLVRTQGTQWVTADGKPVLLKGVNLGN